MQILALWPVSLHALPIPVTMAQIPVTPVWSGVQDLHTETTALGSALQSAFLELLSKESWPPLTLIIQPIIVWISVLKIVGLITSPLPASAFALWGHSLIIRLGSAWQCVLQTQFLTLSLLIEHAFTRVQSLTSPQTSAVSVWMDHAQLRLTTIFAIIKTRSACFVIGIIYRMRLPVFWRILEPKLRCQLLIRILPGFRCNDLHKMSDWVFDLHRQWELHNLLVESVSVRGELRCELPNLSGVLLLIWRFLHLHLELSCPLLRLSGDWQVLEHLPSWIF